MKVDIQINMRRDMTDATEEEMKEVAVELMRIMNVIEDVTHCMMAEVERKRGTGEWPAPPPKAK